MAKRSVFEINRALKFFADNLFIKINQSETGKTLNYSYGANGTLLLRNFLQEWCNENVVTTDKVSMLSTPLFTSTELTPRSSLASGFLSAYNEQLLSNARKFPFAIAASGVCVADSDQPVINMSRPREFTECLVQYFVPEGLVTDVFQKLEVDHLMWWKKLSNSKEFKAQRSDIGTTFGDGSIVYSCNHGDTTVETITVTGPHPHLELSPYIVESRISADVAMLVLLHDAYSEKGGSVQKLKFHQRLAPYKLGLLFDGENKKSLGEVGDYIISELKKEGIMTPASHSSPDQCRLQRSGVPYFVVLTDETLESGTVFLQDLSANTREVVHVAVLKEKILQYVRSS